VTKSQEISRLNAEQEDNFRLLLHEQKVIIRLQGTVENLQQKNNNLKDTIKGLLSDRHVSLHLLYNFLLFLRMFRRF